MSHNDVIKDTNLILSIRSRLLAKPRLFAFGYLIALTVAEVLTVLVDLRAGMLIHGVILLVVMLLAALSPDRQGIRFLLPLAFPPLIRLLSLSLPLTNFNFIYWYVIIGVPLFIATYLTIRATGLNADMIGLRISWREVPFQLLIGLSGLLLGLVEYFILHPEALISKPSWEQILISVLILLVFTGFLEELIFRGVMQASAIQALGQPGLIFVALVFSVLHIGYRSMLDVIFVFTVAIVFGVLVQRYKSLLGVSIAHGLINVSLYLIYPSIFM